MNDKLKPLCLVSETNNTNRKSEKNMKISGKASNMSINNIDEKQNLALKRVEHAIKGATKFDRKWAMPMNTGRPIDGWIISGEYIYWRNKTQ